MRKFRFPREGMYILGMVFLSFGTACMTVADFGLSMVVAPAYVVSKIFDISFGTAEYLFQAVLLVLMMLAIREIKVSYLFSFVTAVLYGLLLNAQLALMAFVPAGSIAMRLFLYVAGMVICAAGVACMLNTYIPAEVYEMIVREVPPRFGWDTVKFKTIYDIAGTVVAVVMSLIVLKRLEGVKLGTVLCALVNGYMIGVCNKWIGKRIALYDCIHMKKA